MTDATTTAAMTPSQALLELLLDLIVSPRTGVLLALLVVAAIIDYRTWRIPNLLTGGGIVFALLYNLSVAPMLRPDPGLVPLGLLFGGCALLPLYAMGVMGAGDVKLMAMVGAFLGLGATAWALLFSIVSAGVLGLVHAGARGLGAELIRNVGERLAAMVWSGVARGGIGAPPGPLRSVGKLAYAISIAIGTSVYLVTRQLGYL
jgi:prepilin peptidase CpaA